MNLQFNISDLQSLVEPDSLIDCLDQLMQMGQLESYFYDWENGYVNLDIPERAVIEDMFKQFARKQ